MEPFLIPAILVILASLSSLLSSVIDSMPSDAFEQIGKKDPTAKSNLDGLVAHHNEAKSAFLIIDILFFSGAAFFLGTASDGLTGSIRFGIVFYLSFLIISIVLYISLAALGKKMAPSFSMKVAPVISFYWSCVRPLARVIHTIDESLAGKPTEEASREELRAMVDSAHEVGGLDAGEYKILKNIMNFNEVLVSDVMTPRTVIFSLEADNKVEDVKNMPELQMYSRIPIWEGESIEDSVVGYVMTRDIYHSALMGKTRQSLRDLSRPMFFIPENAELDIALDSFLKRRQHLFLVVDEYGGIEGLITMEDVLETILGAEIVDEADRVVDLRELAKQRRDRRVAETSKK